MRQALPLLLTLLVAGCSPSAAQQTPPSPSASTAPTVGSGPTTAGPSSAELSSRQPAESASAAARRLQEGIDQVRKVVAVTEDNDPNDLIGRPNGYIDAAVIYDKRATCSELGADCGATIEVWPTAEDARARSDYIQKTLKDNKMLGTEYDTLQGPMLLRVTGELKPSAAKVYAEVFTG